MAAAKKGFVKSADTSTSVVNSRGELEKLLTRYGCSQFAVSANFEQRTASVSFVVSDSTAKDAARIPVRLEVKTREVYAALYGQPQIWRRDIGYVDTFELKCYDEKKLAQAERVAWRQLILWVDAALSAASAGVQKISEAFMAHTLIEGADGKVRRMVDHMDIAAGGSWRARLPASTGG